MLKYVEEEE